MDKKIVLSIITLMLLAVSGIFLKKKLASLSRKDKHLASIPHLRVGTSADFAPFSFRDKTDEIVGFDIDVVKEVSRRMGMNIELIDRPFSMLIAQLQTGQIDVIAAGMTPTPEREKNLRFTRPYLKDNPLVIVTLADKADNQLTADLKDNQLIESLFGKNIIVNTGYVADMYLAQFPKINLSKLQKVSDAMIALEHHKGDAFVTAYASVEPYIERDRSKFTVITIPNTNETSALGISFKVPVELFENIQKTLDAMEHDGFMKTLREKWQLV